MVDNIPVSLIVERVSDGKYLLANRSAETILNRRREDATGLTAADIFNPREAKLIVARDEAAIRKRGLLTEEHPISTKDGLRLFLTRRMTVLDDGGEPQYLIKTHEDVTDRRQTESRMAHMAYHDGLTDLPNRAAFLQALAQMIEACADTDEEFAVLCVDLDGLKEINDVFGHAIGDKVLIEVSRRLQEIGARRRGGAAFRRRVRPDHRRQAAGGGPGAGRGSLPRRWQRNSRSTARRCAPASPPASRYSRITARTRRRCSPMPAPRCSAPSRSRAASIGVFEPEMDQQIRDRRVLHQDLSVAIKNGELSLHYQPQAASGQTVAASKVIGFEALARWMHPLRGFVSPGDFIPLAEESGLIVEMGEWILREACREAASWPVPMQIAVNLSPAQFMHGDVVSLVHSILLETGLAPGRLELEITEGVLIEDFDRGLALLRRLKALGVRISMDDFGSGYSSLSYLQAFPFDKIKIDRAFVINLGKNPQSASIVRAVIGLGHGLEMSIVAEGVETAGATGLPGPGRLRRGAGLSARQAGSDRPICGPGRPKRHQRHGARAQDRLEGDPAPFVSSQALRMADYDLAILGGGLNGVEHRARRRGARPAGAPARAGRPRRRRILGLAAADPWRFVGAGAAAISCGCAPRLSERDVWLKIAPHLVRPMRFAIPAHADERRPGCCGPGCCSTTGSARDGRCRPRRRSMSPITRSATR